MCELHREPTNEHDPNAIAVYAVVDGVASKLGYIPREVAALVALPIDVAGLVVASRVIQVTPPDTAWGVAALRLRVAVAQPPKEIRT